MKEVGTLSAYAWSLSFVVVVGGAYSCRCCCRSAGPSTWGQHLPQSITARTQRERQKTSYIPPVVHDVHTDDYRGRARERTGEAPNNWKKKDESWERDRHATTMRDLNTHNERAGRAYNRKQQQRAQQRQVHKRSKREVHIKEAHNRQRNRRKLTHTC